MISNEQLNEIAMNTAVHIVATVQALNKDLHLEIQKLSNIPQDLYAINQTWFEIAYVGLFIFLRKNPHLRLPEERQKIESILKDDFIFSVINIGFDFKDKENVKEDIKKQLETNGSYELHMKGYSDYRGDIALLLKDQLWNAFNGESSTSKVKFLEDEKLTDIEKYVAEKSKSKLPWKKVPAERGREIIKQILNKQGIEFALPESFLTNVAKGICEAFEEAELVKT